MTPIAKARLATVLAALLASPGQAFLEDALATANAGSSTGSTTTATQSLFVSETFPGSTFFGPATATVSGTMTAVTVGSSCSASSNNDQSASNAQGEVRVTDTITLDVPGLTAGETVVARIAFDLSGSVGRSQTGEVIVQALAIAESPLTTWRKETGNQGGPFVVNPDGTVVFDFLVKVNTPEEDNVDLSLRAASGTSRDPAGDPLEGFSGNANASLTAEFVEMVEVTTLGGVTLYDWTVVAESLLDYGSGPAAPPPPATPFLKIKNSPFTPGDLTVFWHADPAQSLIVQTSTDGEGWFKKQAITLASDSFEVNPPTDSPARLYRIVTTDPDGPLREPVLSLIPSTDPAKVLLRWNAEASQSYRILAGSTLQGWSELQVIDCASGLLTIPLDKPGPSQYYRVVTAFN